jgi:L-ascorbate metabolism protein UlaG (beta-lactamase superfamily)
MYDEAELSRFKVDYVITPVVKQKLPAYTLVDGGEKALRLAEILKAKYVVPMMNGDLEQKGVLSGIIQSECSTEEFEQLVKSSRSKIQVISKQPGTEIALV